MNWLDKARTALGPGQGKAREAILAALDNTTKTTALSPDDLFMQLRGQEVTANLVTIYRALPVLHKAGLVKREYHEDRRGYYYKSNARLA